MLIAYLCLDWLGMGAFHSIFIFGITKYYKSEIKRKKSINYNNIIIKIL